MLNKNVDHENLLACKQETTDARIFIHAKDQSRTGSNLALERKINEF